MHPSSSGERVLCRFAAAMAVGDRAAARRALLAAKRARVPLAAIEETGLMLVLYAGYPAAIEALVLVREHFPEPGESREVEARERRALGERLCHRVYSVAFDKLMSRVRALHPDLATWMIEDGYGRVLSRSGLDARTREVVTISALAATGWRRQLVSHLLGARRLGATAAARRAAFTAGFARADPNARREAQLAWREVEARGRGR